MFLAFFSLVFSRDVPFGIRHLRSEDLPGAYLSLGMLPLLLPSALVTMVRPRWGAPMLAVIGGLGLLGKVASLGTFRGPVFVGLGPLSTCLPSPTAWHSHGGCDRPNLRKRPNCLQSRVFGNFPAARRVPKQALKNPVFPGSSTLERQQSMMSLKNNHFG